MYEQTWFESISIRLQYENNTQANSFTRAYLLFEI